MFVYIYLLRLAQAENRWVSDDPYKVFFGSRENTAETYKWTYLDSTGSRPKYKIAWNADCRFYSALQKMCNLPLPATLHRAVKLLWLLVKLNRNRNQKKSIKVSKKSCKGAPKYPLNSLIFTFDRLYCTVHMCSGHCTPVLYSVASAGSSRQHQREERERRISPTKCCSLWRRTHARRS